MGNPAYLKSTKVPALEDIFGLALSKRRVSEVAAILGSLTHSVTVSNLVLSDTGFTNFYSAYRNQAREWCETNRTQLVDIILSAFLLDSDDAGFELAVSIGRMPMIPKNDTGRGMTQAAYLLTPLCFALDPRIRFPIINQAEGFDELLRILGVESATLGDKYRALIRLYETNPEISDAADIDQAVPMLSKIYNTSKGRATMRLLSSSLNLSAELTIKDESDVIAIQQTTDTIQRRIHNKITNLIIGCLSKYTLVEGRSKDALYDILVIDYDGRGNDLMIEAKSSNEIGPIRMAIGQLFHYWFVECGGGAVPHLAILLPSEPAAELLPMLSWLDIGSLWFEDDQLRTSTPWLRHLTPQGPQPCQLT